MSIRPLLSQVLSEVIRIRYQTDQVPPQAVYPWYALCEPDCLGDMSHVLPSPVKFLNQLTLHAKDKVKAFKQLLYEQMMVDTTGAFDLCTSLCDLHPFNQDAQMFGIAGVLSFKLYQDVSYLEKCLEMDPLQDEFQEFYFYATKSTKFIKEQIRLDPTNPNPWKRLLEASFDVEIAQKIFKMDPLYTPALKGLLNYYQENKDYRVCVELLVQRLDVNSGEEWMWEMLCEYIDYSDGLWTDRLWWRAFHVNVKERIDFIWSHYQLE